MWGWKKNSEWVKGLGYINKPWKSQTSHFLIKKTNKKNKQKTTTLKNNRRNRTSLDTDGTDANQRRILQDKK